MKPETITKQIFKIIPALLLVALSAFLLQGDVWTFWTWYLLALVLGVAAMPLTGRLFRRFQDRGWMFSKVTAIAVSGFLTWFLVAVKIIKFTTVTCIVVTLVCAAASLILYGREQKAGFECIPFAHLDLVYAEELLFFTAFLLWTYFAGFHPAAYGTEKFMDYGFMEAMMRNKTLPATDLWYSQGKINYYYGGQYFAVFLTKLSGAKVELTYNLMRTFVAGLAFAMPFSLVHQMVTDRLGRIRTGWKKALPSVTGILAGISVSIAGNMHYVVYGQIIPFIQKLKGEEVSSYWFPDATRYIGFNPDVEDKTIHEFPCYSFVLGDLHAHVVDIMFVLLLLGLLYAWMKKVRTTELSGESMSRRGFWKKQLLMPQLLAAGALLGMFHWTNYWDFVIYFVVTCGATLFMNIIGQKGKIRWVLGVTAAQAVEIMTLATVIILPFTLQFDTSNMVQGIALAKHHSLPHQLLVLWGLPGILTILFVVSLLIEKLRGAEQKSLYHLLTSIRLPDLFAVLMGLCAIGLVLIPELVYVRDIYENGNARANTMFKLTYQAYIMFGMTMIYAIFRLLVIGKNKILKVLAFIGLFLFVWTCGYFGNSVHSWFGTVWKPSQYKGLNATAFLETDFPEDVNGIRWLKENISDAPVVLEANGDSYSEYERVSAMTGLPTIMGWYVHEWLWRGNLADLNAKIEEIKEIYTSTDETRVKELLDEYNVSYIFVGSCERNKYGADLNNDLLKGLGEVVFQDSEYPTYIVKIN
ncbi:hypothetical protein DWW86_09320 [Ruminococcus sp. AF17-22AC]|uniref:DUF2298 domain-containing protein n=1 Tax=Ruminococcus sp. AF17-22AC TaxID=2292248 RepID=UPI000E538289|nr:DUF2298 domain-containing protein [Ruminococcus sp. AF17-22AC]RGU31793.1 hypothetical protein DWW86_09320 [Ruminococcus sp. AF17-22AC]